MYNVYVAQHVNQIEADRMRAAGFGRSRESHQKLANGRAIFGPAPKIGQATHFVFGGLLFRTAETSVSDNLHVESSRHDKRAK